MLKPYCSSLVGIWRERTKKDREYGVCGGGGGRVGAVLVGSRYAMDVTWWLRLGRYMSVVMPYKKEALLSRNLAGED